MAVNYNVLKDLKVKSTLTTSNLTANTISSGLTWNELQVKTSGSIFPNQGSNISIALAPVDPNIIAFGNSANNVVIIYEYNSESGEFDEINIYAEGPDEGFGKHICFDSFGGHLIATAPKANSFVYYDTNEVLDQITNYAPETSNLGCMYELSVSGNHKTPMGIPLDCTRITDGSYDIGGYETYYSNAFTVHATSNIGAEFNGGLSYGTTYSVSYESATNPKQYTIMTRAAYQPYMTQPTTEVQLYSYAITDLQVSSFCTKYVEDASVAHRLESDILPSINGVGLKYLTSNLQTSTVRLYRLDNNVLNTSGRMQSVPQPVLEETYNDETIDGFGSSIFLSTDGKHSLVGGKYEFKVFSETGNQRISPDGGLIKKLVLDATNSVLFAACEHGVYIYTRYAERWNLRKTISVSAVDIQIQPIVNVDHFYVLVLETTGHITRYEVSDAGKLVLNTKVILGDALSTTFTTSNTHSDTTVLQNAATGFRPRTGCAISADGQVVVTITPVLNPSDGTNLYVEVKVYDNNELTLTDTSIELGSYGPGWYGYTQDVCISGDGNTFLVSGFLFDFVSYIFVRPDRETAFTKKTVDSAPYSLGGGNYHNMAISYDGSVVSFGVYEPFIYELCYVDILRSSDHWDSAIDYAYDSAFDHSSLFTASDMFAGYMTSMSADGNTVVVNAIGGTSSGSLIIYKYDSNLDDYLVAQTLAGPSEASYFGWYVNISADAKTIVTGVADAPNGMFAGQIEIFKLDEKYELLQVISPPVETPYAYVTLETRMSSDGNFIFSYSAYGDGNQIDVYKWNGVKYIKVGTYPELFFVAMFGFQVSADGSKIIIPEYYREDAEHIVTFPTLFNVSIDAAKDTTVQSDLYVKGFTTLDDVEASTLDVASLQVVDVSAESVSTGTLALSNKITQATAEHNELTATRVSGSSYLNSRTVSVTDPTLVKRVNNINWILTPDSINVLQANNIVYTVASTLDNPHLITPMDGSSNVIIATDAHIIEVSNTFAYTTYANTIPSELQPIKGIASLGSYFYVTSHLDGISNVNQLNVGDLHIERSQDLDQGASSVTVVNSNLWITSSQFDTVSVVDVWASVLKRIHVGGFPIDCVEFGANVWVLNSATYNLSVVDKVSYEVIHTVSLGSLVPYTLPNTLSSIATTDDRIIVTDSTGKLMITVDPVSYSVVDTIQVAHTPGSVTYDNARDVVLVATDSNVIAEYTQGSLATSGPIVQNVGMTSTNILGNVLLGNKMALSSSMYSIANLSDSTSNVINLTNGFVTYIINGSNVSPLTAFEIYVPSDPIPDQFILVSNQTGVEAQLHSNGTRAMSQSQTALLSYIDSTWTTLGFFSLYT